MGVQVSSGWGDNRNPRGAGLTDDERVGLVVHLKINRTQTHVRVRCCSDSRGRTVAEG